MEILEDGFEDKNKEVFGSALQVYFSLCPNHFEFIHNYFHKICEYLPDLNSYSQTAAINILSIFCRLFSTPFSLSPSSSSSSFSSPLLYFPSSLLSEDNFNYDFSSDSKEFFKKTILNNNFKYSFDKEKNKEIMKNGTRKVVKIIKKLVKRSNSPAVILSSSMFLFYNSPLYCNYISRPLIKIISFSPFIVLKNIFIISSSQPVNYFFLFFSKF